MLGLYREPIGFTVNISTSSARHNHTLATVTAASASSGLVTPAKTRSAHRKKRPRRPMVGMMLHQDARPTPGCRDAGAGSAVTME